MSNAVLPVLPERPRRPAKRLPVRPMPPRKRQLSVGQRLTIYAVLAGGIVSAQIFSQRAGQTAPAPVLDQVQKQPVVTAPFQLNEELTVIEKQVGLTADVKKLRAGLFAIDPKSGQYIDWSGKETFAAASMIKIPIFVALLIAVDRKEVDPGEIMTVNQDHIAGGSGFLQWHPGESYSLKDVVNLMITHSDNTATNMVIDRLGGKEKLNRQIAEWGLQKTCIANYLGDFEGTNKTSPYDLVYLLGRVDAGDLISPKMKSWMYQTMAKTRVRTLIPPGLAPGSKMVHKTGDIASMVGDAGIVTTPNGKRYIISIQVERPRNDRRANLLIQKLSKVVYPAFAQAPDEAQ